MARSLPLLSEADPIGSFQAVRQRTEALAAPLSPEDQTVQSMPDASPTKWHLAHTSWFFETFLLKPSSAEYQVFHPEYEVLFNSYYNAVGAQFPRSKRGMISRPRVDEVLRYRRHVDDAMCELLKTPERYDAHLVELGLHHEQQHQELLLTDIKHVLSQNPLNPIYLPLPTVTGLRSQETSAIEYVTIKGGRVAVGHQGGDFHFDNETPRHEVLLNDFQLAERPLNNQDVIDFIQAGGYHDPLLWLSDGWSFRESQRLQHPMYWQQGENGEYSHFTLHGRIPVVPAETACHLTYFECDAIARFFDARLPTEQEWEHAASLQSHEAPQFQKRAIRPGVPEIARTGELRQMLGGVWEWTQSPYVPYPGYEAPAGAVGEYNGKFMHNQYVLRGGSAATSDGHTRRTYRNFFPSHAQWQFTGARLAKGLDR